MFEFWYNMDMTHQHKWPLLLGMTCFYGGVVCNSPLTRFCVKLSRKRKDMLAYKGNWRAFSWLFYCCCIPLEGDKSFSSNSVWSTLGPLKGFFPPFWLWCWFTIRPWKLVLFLAGCEWFQIHIICWRKYIPFWFTVLEIQSNGFLFSCFLESTVFSVCSLSWADGCRFLLGMGTLCW